MKHVALVFLFIFISSCSFLKKDSPSESEKVNQFFKSSFEQKLARYPGWQTWIGRKTNYDRLNNYTDEYDRETFALEKKLYEELKRFDYEKLDEQTKLSYKISLLRSERGIEGDRWRYHGYPLNQMFGFHTGLPSFLMNMHRVESVQDAKDLISRMREVKRVFRERLVFIKEQEKRGIIPPRFVFQKILADSKNIIKGAPFDKSKKNSPLFQNFIGKVNKLEISGKEKKELIGEAREVLKDYIKPAYLGFISSVSKLEKKAKGDFGVWNLPNGKEYYNFVLKQHTTSNISADEIHKIGLAQVKRIHDEMKVLIKRIGYRGSLQEFFTYIKTNKDKFLFPNTEEGKKQYLEETERVVNAMKSRLGEIFKTFPKAELEIRPVEPFREKTAPTAFYNGPGLEGNRPGIYYVNLFKMDENPKYQLEALAYHEAVPGHHMQIAIASELKHLPEFRRTGGFTAYSEGWGLYAERLPKEFGFYQDPYSDFGRLSMELWRAVRLVVDTGIHAKKWSKEKAINYFYQNTAQAKISVVKEVERYFVIPGQATSYMIGMLKILDLRKKAKDRLKDKFDIREFHDVVLRGGAVPLKILEEQVDEWIERKL